MFFGAVPLNIYREELNMDCSPFQCLEDVDQSSTRIRGRRLPQCTEFIKYTGD